MESPNNNFFNTFQVQTKFLYSNIQPLLVQKNQEIIHDCFKEEIQKADQLKIAVGFSSYSSLWELDKLITQHKIKNICLILGMYFFNGFPKKLFKLALAINSKWQKTGIGEIRVTYSLKYHGKLYCFIKNDQITSAILGSPNLSFLTIADQTHLKQYEIAFFTNDSQLLESSVNHINRLASQDISENIDVLKKKQLLSYKSTQYKRKRNFKID
ncbi:hypothetical protein DNK47_02595 [Mycoplasma wenyonii]|uniref:Restriction endonuclease type II NgoFVII N-terminal domain-containing protein n=1 Tax=Mycoplasma wenyonii TaxID=65123 RepID=A0A328PUW7_9MOLU|nr:hypothetical protein DNK47_02595 [Mycoplasma wenyonii]